MLRNVSGWHILVVLVIVLLLFGANRLPDLARSVGRSLKIFKEEVKDLTGDDAPRTTTTTTSGDATAPEIPRDDEPRPGGLTAP